jgi:acyl transferase domain-containing protein
MICICPWCRHALFIRRLQLRLERVWRQLGLTSSEQIQLIKKYSTAEFAPRLAAALRKWEDAARIVERKDQVMQQLFYFDRDHSDPKYVSSLPSL